MPFQVNFYLLSSIIASIYIFAVGLWVGTISIRDDVRAAFTRMTTVVSITFLTQALIFMTTDYTVGGFLQQLLWLPAMLIPPSVYAFVVTLLDLKKWKRLVPFYNVLSLLFILMVLSPHFFNYTVIYNYPWGHVYQIGPLGVLALFFMVCGTFATAGLLIVLSRHEKNAARLKRMRILTLATILGSLGAIDFLENFGIGFPLTGAVWIAIWITVYIHAIVHYRLFDLTPEFASETVIRKMPGALFICDDKMRVSITNDSPFGISTKKVYGMSIENIVPGIHQVLATHTTSNVGLHSEPREMQVHLPGERIVPSLVTTSVIQKHGKVFGYVIFAEDMTSFHEQHKKIEEKNVEMANIMEELKKMQKSLVNRELRMVELKDALKKIDHRQS